MDGKQYCFGSDGILLTGCGAEETPYVPTGDGLTNENDVTAPTVPETPKELKLAYDPTAGLHPYQCNEPTNRMLFSLMYQGLFTAPHTVAQALKTAVFAAGMLI